MAGRAWWVGFALAGLALAASGCARPGGGEAGVFTPPAVEPPPSERAALGRSTRPTTSEPAAQAGRSERRLSVPSR